MTNFTTALDIISTAAQELGLGQISNPTNPSDNLGYQCLGLLNSLCDEVWTLQDWQTLMITQEYVGDGVQSVFEMPDDFGRQVNQTEWDSTNHRVMYGPASPQVWGWIKYGLIGVGIQLRYRIINDTYEVAPTPGLDQTINLYYISKNWCKRADDTLTDRITLPDDTPLFDRRMLICGLKTKLWAIKGFDNTVLKGEFDAILESYKGQNAGAPVLYLGTAGPGFRLLDINNFPDGTYNNGMN
jgi:hypothetical protein